MTLGSILESLSDGALAETLGRELCWPTSTRAALLWARYQTTCSSCDFHGRVVAYPSENARSTGVPDRVPEAAWCVWCWERHILENRNPKETKVISTKDKNAAREAKPDFYVLVVKNRMST